jgi:hypothetical protein
MSVEDNQKAFITALRGSGALYHRTSVESLGGILATGFVFPNVDRFVFTTCQSQNSYGRLCGAVCLFDFDTEPLDRIWMYLGDWASLLTDMGPATVLIEIAREKLDASKLLLPGSITGNACPRVTLPDGSYGCPVVAPWVEAVYHEPVPVSAFHRYVVVRAGGEYEHRRLAHVPGALKRIIKLNEKWRAVAR